MNAEKIKKLQQNAEQVRTGGKVFICLKLSLRPLLFLILKLIYQFESSFF